MQERNLTELIGSAFTKKKPSTGELKKKMEALSFKNKKDLSFKNLPDYLRTPTADELLTMREWAVNYRKSFPHESKRQVRKAVQEHFKIRIFR